jgi:hypothetical protein
MDRAITNAVKALKKEINRLPEPQRKRIVSRLKALRRVVGLRLKKLERSTLENRPDW